MNKKIYVLDIKYLQTPERNTTRYFDDHKYALEQIQGFQSTVSSNIIWWSYEQDNTHKWDADLGGERGQVVLTLSAAELYSETV